MCSLTSRRRVHQPALLASLLILAAAHLPAQAQTTPPSAAPAGPIERIKLTDNELNCAQIHAEAGQMDKLIADAKAAEDKEKTTGSAASAATTVADVAGKLGMFGRIGGLGGALLGQAAAQAGAGALQKSAQESAQQMAARAQQAGARKEHLTGLFLAKECKVSDLNAPGKVLSGAEAQKVAAAPQSAAAAAAQGAPVAPVVVAAAATATTAPAEPTKEVTDQTLAGERLTPLALKLDVINPEDLLSSNKTLVIPTLYLSLITQGRVSATKQSGMFQSGNATARSSANYRVEGIDKAYAQKLAQAILDNLITQLRQAGYNVLTYADVKDRDVFKAAARDPSASAFNEGSNDYLVVTPSDEQMFKTGFGGIVFSEFWSGGKTRIADATLLIPQFTFHAPQAWAEGSRGYKSVSATTNVVHGMNMWTARVTWLGQPVSRMGRGMPGVATREQVINVSERVGTLSAGTDASPDAANALSGVLNALSGAGNIQRKVTNYVLTIDRDAFAAGVINGAYNFNTEVARAAAAAKP